MLVTLSKLLPEAHHLGDVRKVEFKIKAKEPPNFKDILKVFPQAKHGRVLFCHDHVIYNPQNMPVTFSLAAHECTHMLQQDALGVAHWWEFYLRDPKFVFSQELDAYRIEYRDFASRNSRHMRKQYCRSCAERLSGPLYNNTVGTKTALKLIEEETDLEQRARDEWNTRERLRSGTRVERFTFGAGEPATVGSTTAGA